MRTRATPTRAAPAGPSARPVTADEAASFDRGCGGGRVQQGAEVRWNELRIAVETALTASERLKGPKTRCQRTFHADADTMAMFKDVCDATDEQKRGSRWGRSVQPDTGWFAPDPAGLLTKRVGALTGYLGIEDKRREQSSWRTEALRLRRPPPSPRRAGLTGPLRPGRLSSRALGIRPSQLATRAPAAAGARPSAQPNRRA